MTRVLASLPRLIRSLLSQQTGVCGLATQTAASSVHMVTHGGIRAAAASVHNGGIRAAVHNGGLRAAASRAHLTSQGAKRANQSIRQLLFLHGRSQIQIQAQIQIRGITSTSAGVKGMEPGVLARARRMALWVGALAGGFGSLVGVGGGVLISPIIANACK